ncbi:MAG: hypothetical protein JWN04_2801 [Myxococcaceae bacterium]|nr:hypothetical protein [Myxococcaceae bacterium]
MNVLAAHKRHQLRDERWDAYGPITYILSLKLPLDTSPLKPVKYLGPRGRLRAHFVYTWVFRIFGRYNMGAIQALVMLVAVATAFSCGRIAPVQTLVRLRDDRERLRRGTSVYVRLDVLLPEDAGREHRGARGLAISRAVMVYLLAQRSAGGRALVLNIAAGGLAAVALLFKQVALTSLVALLADRGWRAWRGGSSTRALREALVATGAILVGAAAVVLPVVLFFDMHGILGDAVFWSWTYAWRYYIPREIAAMALTIGC